jgi:hypothetical protein
VPTKLKAGVLDRFDEHHVALHRPRVTLRHRQGTRKWTVPSTPQTASRGFTPAAGTQ